MAIGDFNSSNNTSEKMYDSTFYSRLRFKNENKNISINFRSGLLIVEINEQDASYKNTPVATIYISPLKAQLLSKEIKKFNELLETDDPDENIAYGINGGLGEKVSYLALHTNKDKDIIITIGKFDSTGSVIESADFVFKKDYNYAIEWEDLKANKIVKYYDDTVEFYMFAKTIIDFANYMNGSLGYSVADINRYEQGKIIRKMDPIYDRLGIERRNPNTNQRFAENNFLSNSSSSKSISMEELNNMI